jgi:hypothetical protein
LIPASCLTYSDAGFNQSKSACRATRRNEGEPARNAGVAQWKSGALIRRRSVVQISPPAPAFAASRLRLASHSVAKIARRSFSEGGLQNIPAVVQRSERLNVDQVTHVRFVPQGPAGRLMKGCPPKLQRRRANSSDVPFPRGCSSAAERRSPKPRRRGFDPCLPRQFSGRSCRSSPPEHRFKLLKTKAEFRSNLLGLSRD